MNTNRCHMCANYILISNLYAREFIEQNWNSQRNKKYMVMLFRLLPFLFQGFDLSTSVLKDIEIPFGTSDESFEYVFNGYFHQPHLTAADYEICDACGVHLCPIHLKLNPMCFDKCNHCKKNWCICLQCINSTNEKDMCQIVHKPQP